MAETRPDNGDTHATPPGVERVHDDHHAPTVARNARVGLWLFGVYVLLYGGFMALNAFYPRRMGQPVFAGVNLAVTYGLLLILAAFVLALLYMFLVRGRADDNGREGR
jgi:uncharacterized membrane protein (DUF485 family)